MTWVHPRDRKHPPRRLFPKHKHWQACYNSWLNALYTDHSQSDDTVRMYTNICRRFFIDPKRAPDAYTTAEVREFLDRPGREKTPAMHTRNMRLKALRSFYGFASRYDVPFRNTTRPLLSKRPPTASIRYGKTGKVKRAMDDDELERFFLAIDRETIQGKRDRALFVTYFWTGRRCSEICRLRWGDIERAVFVENGKTRQGWLYSWKGKGRVARSQAELPIDAYEAICEYLRASGRMESMTAESPVFVGRGMRANIAITRDEVGYLYKKYTHLAGLVKRHGVHDFRHTCAVLTYRENRDILEVQRKLDHEDISSTMYYVADVMPQGDITALKLHGRYGHL